MTNLFKFKEKPKKFNPGTRTMAVIYTQDIFGSTGVFLKSKD